MCKMKAFVDDKQTMTKNIKFVLNRVENIVGKGKYADYQYFLLFLRMLPKDKGLNQYQRDSLIDSCRYIVEAQEKILRLSFTLM